MTDKGHFHICFCDPFLLSGLLPTLAAATLKAAVTAEGYKAAILYPSVEFYALHRLDREPVIAKLVDDIPLQILELLFDTCTDQELKSKLEEINPIRLDEGETERLMHIRAAAWEAMDRLVDDIAQRAPRLFCYSLTFGGYHFTCQLFRRLRERILGITIAVGGSNCTPEFAGTVLEQFPQVDYVLCDETPYTLLLLLEALRNGVQPESDCIAFHGHSAVSTHMIESMDELPCPDFDDYMELLSRLGVDTGRITLPYEMSRGCWWCELKPCTMCGFFGNRRHFVIKSPEKMIRELLSISERYSVRRFRFSDLVQPYTEYLRQLLPLEAEGFRLFWELRPDMTGEDISLIRRLGMAFGQIGLESLSTPALLLMNKGSTAINNIYILIQAGTYKIDLVWNYLYGFPEDRQEWYEQVLELIPRLHHLQPPIPRKLWINRYSAMFENKTESAADVEETFLSSVFPQKSSQDEFCALHDRLLKTIAQWRSAYSKGCSLCFAPPAGSWQGLVRYGEQEEHIPLDDGEILTYLFYSSPHTIKEGVSALGIPQERLEAVLNDFIDQELMLFLDNRYLALATGHSRYKWVKSEEQVLYMGEKMFRNK